jgi:hypothetical protein
MEKFLGTKHEIQCEVFFNTKVQNIIYDLCTGQNFPAVRKRAGADSRQVRKFHHTSQTEEQNNVFVRERI